MLDSTLKRSRPIAARDVSDLDLTLALQLLRQAGYSDADADALQDACGKEAGSPLGLQTIIDRLCDISLRDGLTGLANSRQFAVALGQEVDRVSRSGEIALLLLIDLDYFKEINDTYGHTAGDQALRAVADVLSKNVRPMDTAARYGGDELAVILPNCRPGAGRVIAERIREQVEQTAIVLPDGTQFRLTTSIGGAHLSPWRRLGTEAVFDKADQELYRAKAEGRNRVSMDVPGAMPVSSDEKHQLLDPFGKATDD